LQLLVLLVDLAGELFSRLFLTQSCLLGATLIVIATSKLLEPSLNLIVVRLKFFVGQFLRGRSGLTATVFRGRIVLNFNL
jgi:hypothetical protein